MNDAPPQIDPVVDRKIDTKIAEAQIIPSTDSAASVPPSTTLEEDLHSASQRHVNIIWERTQQVIALTVVFSTMVAGVYITIRGDAETHIPTILAVAFGTVVGFYFGRTNHEKVGGVRMGR